MNQHDAKREQKSHLPAGNYEQTVQARATAPAPAGTRPYGIPVDDAEFMAFLAKGGFTDAQVVTLRKMIDMMKASLAEGKAQGVITPEVETKTLATIKAMEDAVKDYPADIKFDPFK